MLDIVLMIETLTSVGARVWKRIRTGEDTPRRRSPLQ